MKMTPICKVTANLGDLKFTVGCLATWKYQAGIAFKGYVVEEGQREDKDDP